MSVLFFLALDLGNGLQLQTVRVESGTFLQGSPVTEVGREADEVQREVRISKPFEIGLGLVRKQDFAQFVKETGYKTEAEKGASGGFGVEDKKLVQRKEYTWQNPGYAQRDTDPVVLVTYKDALAFTEWLSKRSGRRVRLPTEAEWEFAARRHGELVDMFGKVNQWCSDGYALWSTDDAVDPVGVGEKQVLRGGSFLRDERRARAAARTQQSAGSRNADNGFRVVVEEGEAAPLQAESAPGRTEGGPRNEGPGDVVLGLVVLFFIAVMGLLPFYLFYRWWKRRRRQEITSDGFRLKGQRAGSRVRVRYRDPQGQRITRVVDVETDDMFVFTGYPIHTFSVTPLAKNTLFVASDDDDSADTTTAAASSTWNTPSAY